MESVACAVQEQVRWLCIARIGAEFAHGVVDVAVHHQQVEPSIEIGVEEETAESQAALRKPPDVRARRLIDIDAALGAAVKPQHLVVEIRYHQARNAGVVVIRHVHAHAGARFAVFAEGHARL